MSSIAESYPIPGRIEATEPLALSLVPEIKSYESTIGGFLVKPEVISELDTLRSLGVDASVMDVAPKYVLDPEVQDQVDRQSEAVAKLPKRPIKTSPDIATAAETIFDPLAHSAGATWAALSKRAIALRTLTEAGSELPHMIAPGIDPAVYEEPLFNGSSAVDLLRAKYTNRPETAERIHANYRAITTTPLEDAAYEGDPVDSPYMRFLQENGFPFLESRLFLTGVVDSRAVDTRAIAATRLALDHVLANPEHFADRPLVTASLACGAAAPMFELNNVFAANGLRVGRNILVDNDPMALASAVGLGRSYGMSERVDARLEDIIKLDPKEYIEPKSVDIVDILGIVDYLPTSKLGYKAAANFIGKIKEIMRPGGIIVAGNALLSRPHQEFFEKVWPTLQQRDPLEMMEIIEDAGYDRRDVQVRVPQREGVYGIYGIKIPSEADSKGFTESRFQGAARKILMAASRFNKY